mmetsp:Transcript_22795/g.63378  ORF Transcript_22795/g.63378 Transcript_22795/m.63378 type:complete len:209 (-) Transcript_22795:3022-3648(-)
MNTSVRLEQAKQSPICKRLNTRKTRKLKSAVRSHRRPTTDAAPPRLARTTPPWLGSFLLDVLKDHVGRLFLSIMNLGEITNPKNHEKGCSKVFIALTTIAKCPSVDFIVHHSSHVVEKHHHLALQVSEEHVKLFHGNETKQCINAFSRNSWVENNSFAVFRSCKIRRYNTCTSNTPTLPQQVCNLCNCIDQLLRLEFSKLFRIVAATT